MNYLMWINTVRLFCSWPIINLFKKSQQGPKMMIFKLWHSTNRSIHKANLAKFPCCDLYWSADVYGSINNAAFIEVACDVIGNMAWHTETAKQIQMAQTQVKWQLCVCCGYGCQCMCKHWGMDLCSCYYGDASSFTAMGNFYGTYGIIHQQEYSPSIGIFISQNLSTLWCCCTLRVTCKCEVICLQWLTMRLPYGNCHTTSCFQLI